MATIYKISRSKLKEKVILQSFEGYIDKIDDNEETIGAIINDLTNKDLPDEYIEIYKSAINANDLKDVREGSIFYWDIGYFEGEEGKKTFSEIKFKRYTKKDIAIIKKRIRKSKKIAKNISNLFKE